MNQTLERKYCDLASFKMDEGGHGSFSGYLSVFGVLDRQGDIITKGAFQGTLERFKEQGFITLSHDWDALPVASIKEAKEDDTGLWIECEYHSTPEAQKARTYVRERIQRKKSVGLSVGFFLKEARPGKEGRMVTKADPVEGSIVTMPANPEAGIARAKGDAQRGEAQRTRHNAQSGEEETGAGRIFPAATSGQSFSINTSRSSTNPEPDPDPSLPSQPCALCVERRASLKAQYLGDYAEQEMTWSVLGSLSGALYDALYMCLFGTEGGKKERLKAADACLAEFHSLLMGALKALYPQDAADTKALAAEVKDAWGLKDSASDPPAGKEFDAEIERTLVALTDLIARSRDIHAMRQKQGRTLSGARREDLAALHEQMGALLKELAPRASEQERHAAELSHYRRKAAMRAVG